jgi:uncharacterized RDD family membrane protein YckC
MSTSAVLPYSDQSWKQEVNRRLAAHKSRRGHGAAQPAAPAPSYAAAGGLGAQVAARVAARFAQAPSYSQLQACEARSEVSQQAIPIIVVHSSAARVCAEPAEVVPETSSLFAAEPEEAAPAFFAGLAPAPLVAQHWEPEAQLTTVLPHPAPEHEAHWVAPHALPVSLEAWENEFSHFSQEPDLRFRPIEPDSSASVEDSWPRPALVDDDRDLRALDAAQPEPPAYANLITFPREHASSRRARSRRFEADSSSESLVRQLSIFEVEPAPSASLSEPESQPHAAVWTEPAWSGISLEHQTQEEPEQEESSLPQPEIHLAPFGHRLMATLVDGALISLAVLGVALLAAAVSHALPSARVMELSALAGFILIGFSYQSFFLLLAGVTPGMRYASVSLCTFDGQIPSRDQLRSRLGALLLSVAPLGLGAAWAIFDEDRLCWHDRLSRTYLRMS